MNKSKKIIFLTENNVILLERIILQESIFEASSLDEIKEILKKMIKKGIIISAALLSSIISFYNLSNNEAEELKNTIKQEEIAIKQNGIINKSNENNINNKNIWNLAADDVIATVYNAVPAQCDDDCDTTASMFKLNLKDVMSHKIIAMERTFMKELGLKYGDVVKIEGTGKYDGEYQIQDTMNKRFAGMHKIDILVPNNIKLGKWNNVKLYILKDKSLTSKIKANMAPSLK